MKDRSCWRCGKVLAPGSLTYVVQVKVFADFDGVLAEPEEGMDQQLEQILEQIKRSDPDELEKDVYEEFTLLLCKSCRDQFMDETQHPWMGPFHIHNGPDRILH